LKCKRGLISIAILAAIIFSAFIITLSLAYYALYNVRMASERSLSLEKYKVEVLKTTESFFVLNFTTNTIDYRVKTAYDIRIAMYVIIYRSGDKLLPKIISCVNDCYLIHGINSKKLSPPAGIPLSDIVGFKIVTEEGIVIPVPRRL